jgi:hypothetical protein
MKSFPKALLTAVLFFTLATSALAAQTPATTTSPEILHPSLAQNSTTTPTSVGLSSCFDYYTFGSVSANVSSALPQVAQSASVGFVGTLTNQNNYPIIDATVYVKIFRSRLVNGNRTDANGPDVVAFYPAMEHVNLKANGSGPLSFTWQVPADAQPGDYQAATFVVTSDRFEMQGLVFTDDVVGNSTNFTVVGSDMGGLRFNKASAMINGQPYSYAAFPPTIPPGAKTVPISSDIMNSTASAFKGTVTWSLYYWDPVNQSHLLDTKTEDFKIHPNASTTVNYTVTDTAHSVYYVEGKLQTKDGGSISVIGMRFVRGDVNEPRFNFVAMDNGTAVACIHSSGTAPAPNGRVTLSVIENNWYSKLLARFGIGYLARTSYQGVIPGDLSAVTQKVTHSASSYLITADLYQGDTHIDSVSIPYSCTDLGVPCPNPILQALIALVSFLVLIGLIVFGVRVYKKKKMQKNLYQNTPTA